MPKRLVPCVLPLLLVACATAPSEKTTPANAACYGPTCCADPRSLEFEPHRLNCASIEQRSQGDGTKAWTLLHEALAAARAAEPSQPEPSREVLCFTLNDAGHGHGMRGEIEAARAAFDGSLAACRARFGEGASETAQSAYSRANYRLALGETDAEVASDFDLAERIFEAKNLPGMRAIVLDAKGRMADMQGRHADGERLLLEALEIKRKTFGESSVEAGTTLTNLGANAIEQGDLAQGAKWYQAAMDNYRTDPGPTSGRYLSVAGGLATTWLEMEQYDLLEPLYQELIKSTGSAYGADDERHVTLLNDYAVMLFRRGDADRAQALFESALSVRRRTQPEALLTAWTAFNTAQASLKSDGCRAARPHAQLAKDILAGVDAANAPADRQALAESLGAFEKGCPLR